MKMTTALIRLLVVIATLIATMGPVRAQERVFPDAARLGWLQVGVFPEATLDGKAIRLSPGARILDESNLVVTPGSVSGRRRVLYLVDGTGELLTVWLLTADEIRSAERRPRPAPAPAVPAAPGTQSSR